MHNKAWFFGDSFTFGDGCRVGYEYYEKYPTLRENIWTDLISEKLNLEQVNKGIPGNSNGYILKQLIENLINFKSGDYIFLSDTLPIRVLYPNKETKTVEPLTTDILLGFNDTENFDLDKKVSVNKFLSNKEEKKTAVEYIYQSVVGKETSWSNFYNEQFSSIQNFLLSKGVAVYTWSYKLWAWNSMSPGPPKYESIGKATRGKIDDGHWSWNGHKDFYTDFVKRIEKKDYTFKFPLI